MENKVRYIAKKLREARGATPQQEVSSKLGISQAVVSKIESGLREPTALELWLFANLYKKPVDFFFGEEKRGDLFISEDEIVSHIISYGYPLLIVRKKMSTKTHLSLEDTVISVLKFFSEPRLIEAIPSLIYLNNINFNELFEKAWHSNIQNRLGYIIDVTMCCFKKYGVKKKYDELKSVKMKLEEVKLAREDSFVEDVEKLSENALKYLRQTRDEFARRWNVLDRFSTSNFMEAFKNVLFGKAA